MVAWESLLKRVETVAFVNRLWLAYRRLPRKGHQHPPHKGHLRPPCKGIVRICLELYGLLTDLGHQTNDMFVDGFFLAAVPSVTFKPYSSTGID